MTISDDNLTREQLADLYAIQDVDPDIMDIPDAGAQNWAEATRLFKRSNGSISLRRVAGVLD